MAKIIFEELDKTVELSNQAPIEEACRDAGVPFNCTDGLCGTCVITVIDGMEQLSEYCEVEADFLGDLDCQRLACQCKIKEGAVKVRF